MPKCRPRKCEFERLGFARGLAVGRGRIGIAAIGADQAIDHRLESGRRLVPVDGRDDHDAVRAHPQRIDLVHPVVGLPERVVWIAAARPVAECHRGGDAGLAGVNLPAELGRQPRQIEHIDRQAHLAEGGLGDLDHAPAFGHLAGTRVLAARGAVDQQDMRRFVWIVVPALRFIDGIARGQPIDREIIVGIGKTGAGLAGNRRLARMTIGVPGAGDDRRKLRLHGLKDRIGKSLAVAPFEFIARKLDRRHPLANVRLRHRHLSLPTIHRPPCIPIGARSLGISLGIEPWDRVETGKSSRASICIWFLARRLGPMPRLVRWMGT
ncbi:hypothetical protein ACVMIH_005937 [Bradyrhizobium sp. USDA 4503]